MAQLIVDLPGNDGRFILVMLRHGPDDTPSVCVHLLAVEAIHMPAAKGTLGPVFKLGEDIGVLFGQPGGNGSRGGTHHNAQAPGLRPPDHMVEKGEVKPPLCRFHDVPAKLCDSDGIASQLLDIVQVLLQHGGSPLFRIIINAKPHDDSTFLLLAVL